MAERNILQHALLATWFLLFLQVQSTTPAPPAPVTRSIRYVPHERDALLAFRAGLTDPDSYLSSWRGEDCCRWKGIRCSNRTGHVLELRLRSFEDVSSSIRFRGGQMSSSPLQDLKNLRTLDLRRNNNMSGTIPEALASFMAMTRNPADNDSLSEYSSYGGGFDEVDFVPNPDTLSVVTKGQKLKFMTGIMYMVNLDLSCNKLNGHLPNGIGKLVALRSLNMSWNHLSGTIPDSIGGVHALESLDLSPNELSGNIPTNLSVLTSLSHLNLSYNNLEGTIPAGNQLQALDDQPSIYIGNPGLCGPPLSKNCSETDFTAATPEGHKGEDAISLSLAVGCGYVMGLWTIFCIFLFKANWRAVCFAFSDCLYDRVYVQVALSWAFLTRRKL